MDKVFGVSHGGETGVRMPQCGKYPIIFPDLAQVQALSR